MNARERVAAVCRGEGAEYLPASFWGHDYAAETSVDGLVEFTLRDQREFGWDFVKINPRAQYHVEDWGVKYDYPLPSGAKCVRTDYPIHGPADYSRIRKLDPNRVPALSEHLRAVERIAGELPDVPVIMTVFNPLSVLKYAAESEHAVVSHLRSHPAEVRAALDAVRDTFAAFSAEALRRGAAGIYFATTAFASHDLWTPADYRRLSREDDMAVLGAVSGAPFNVAHICRARNFLEEFRGYPVAALSWASTEPGNPGIGHTPWWPGGAIGGISQDTKLQEATPDSALAELDEAFKAGNGRRFLLGPGCSIPPNTPRANLHALREASRRLVPGKVA